MRGFRLLGKIELVSARDWDPSDILAFSPSEDGSDMREGMMRGRDFDVFACQTAVTVGMCPSDYVWVATALGEHCFA